MKDLVSLRLEGIGSQGKEKSLFIKHLGILFYWFVISLNAQALSKKPSQPMGHDKVFLHVSCNIEQFMKTCNIFPISSLGTIIATENSGTFTLWSSFSGMKADLGISKLTLLGCLYDEVLQWYEIGPYGVTLCSQHPGNCSVGCVLMMERKKNYLS